jgi:DNA repair protein RadC
MLQIEVVDGEVGTGRVARCKTLAAGSAPEERILRSGAESLSNPELLATLLGLDVASAERLLELQAGELGRLFSVASGTEATLSPIRRARFLAARELACRLAAERVPESDPLQRPEDLARYLNLRYSVRDQEVLGALFLNCSGRVLRQCEIYRGTLTRASVEAREVLKQALLAGAAHIVLFHNHPSGELVPSLEDHAFTRLFAQTAPLLGIRLLDHLILGSAGRWLSMRDVMAW